VTRISRASSFSAGRLALLLVALTLLSAVGCGKRGSPRPPLPRGPAAPQQVVARQIGLRSLVGFRIPSPRGPEPGQQPVRAELLRVTYPPGLEPAQDPDAFRRRGDVVAQLVGDPLEANASVMLEDLRLAELSDNARGWTLRYAVRVRDRRGRMSPLVVAPDLNFLPWLGSPGTLLAEPTADGVRLRWQQPTGESSATFNVYRSAPDAPWPDEPLNGAPIEGVEYLDTTVETGLRYLYSVRPVMTTERPYREGEPSSTAEIVAVDRFAPAPPSGLVAVQEGQAVRLFWNPSEERDLAGYRIERSTDGATWQRVATSESATYLDRQTDAPRSRRYRVLAYDRSVPPNVSEPSEAAPIELAETQRP
jgi:hypothetical protein